MVAPFPFTGLPGRGRHGGHISARAVAAHPSPMSAWITLFALTVLFALALRHGRSKELPMPPGYDGERQLTELHALITARNPLCRRILKSDPLAVRES